MCDALLRMFHREYRIAGPVIFSSLFRVFDMWYYGV